ncbi:hypothetical protein DI53_2315 [Sphingobacterium deserti]|uniref:Uncharacterized protein n=1 Tax=Sphingobacterium deserti TaxID=1229276 RepID=A0A0B8T3W0_9SPHI|nr:hypothetical protein DI53_2315 [Sphingobacterium deserti]
MLLHERNLSNIGYYLELFYRKPAKVAPYSLSTICKVERGCSGFFWLIIVAILHETNNLC